MANLAAEPQYVTLRKGTVARQVEVDPLSSVILDVDTEGKILGVEVLDGSDWTKALVTMALDGRLVVAKKRTQQKHRRQDPSR